MLGRRLACTLSEVIRSSVRTIVLGLALSGCGATTVASPTPTQPGGSGTAAAPPAPTSPTAAPSPVTGPASAGAVADAGTLYLLGDDDQIYRYDGPTGSIDPRWARSTFGPRTSSGVYALGREGGAELLGWDGAKTAIECGARFVTSIVPGIGCASVGDDGVSVQLVGERSARRILPADWGASAPILSPDGRRIAVVRAIERRPPGPGMDPGLAALWVIEPDGRSHEVYRPAGRGVLSAPQWSPDGTKLIVRQTDTTSASFAADLLGISTVLIDLGTATSRSLGATRSETWSRDGRLAFVRGGYRMTWYGKQLWMVDRDGGEHRLAGDTHRVALAPAWAPRDEIAWVDGPATELGDGDGYIDGRGAGQRTAVIRRAGTDRPVACADGRVVEGVAWSNDAAKLLLLCRKPGREERPLELWLYRLADDTATPLVTNLPSDRVARGFGFYGAQPPLTVIAAWSLAASR